MTHVRHGSELRDVAEYATTGPVEPVFTGVKWDVVAEDVDLGNGTMLRREYLSHPGSVAVLAIDDQDRVLLIRQYRHPVRMRLWELPAGLLDEPGEDVAVAAARELAEEADVVARRLDVLIDYVPSPGGSDESQRIFLARQVQPVPEAERHVRSEEEAGIEIAWFGLDDVVAAVLAGHLHNAGAVLGVLAAAAARAVGWSTLRPVDTPWPEHPDRRATPRPVPPDRPSTIRKDVRAPQS